MNENTAPACSHSATFTNTYRRTVRRNEMPVTNIDRSSRFDNKPEICTFQFGLVLLPTIKRESSYEYL
jgi:hypothetical protein